jgi:hypothetical protein
MLIITGTGRCGTSFFAEWLYRCGYTSIGGDWRERINAGRERPEIVKLNGGIFRGTIEPEEIAERIKGIDCPVIKDPRFVSQEVAAKWLEHRSDLRFVLMYRDCRAAAESTRSALRIGHERYGTASDHAAILRGRLLRFAKACRDASAPVTIVRYPQVLTDFQLAYRTATLFGGLTLDRKTARHEWNNLVDRDLVHFSSGRDPFYDTLVNLLNPSESQSASA